MRKPTFLPLSADGKRLDPIAYTPLIYIVGTGAVRLALHRDLNHHMPDRFRRWQVSDPISGVKVAIVGAYHKGVPVSSAGMGLREARAAAMGTLDTILERFGTDEFTSRLDKARAQYAAAA
jgi:hypothetical protein